MSQKYRVVDMNNDLTPEEEEDRQTAQRRLFMYSAAALAVAKSIEQIYVSHSQFGSALEACDRIFQLSGELQTPNGGLLCGPTGSGKTTLIDYFRASLPASTLFERGFGAISIRLQKQPTPGSVISSLLEAVDYPFPKVPERLVYLKRNVAMEALALKGTKLVFVDEGQNLESQARRRGDGADDSVASDILNEVMDKPRCGLFISSRRPIVLEQIDPALAGRVTVRLELSNFAPGPAWAGFLNAFVGSSKSFDLSFLLATGEPERLHVATDGNLRSFKRLVTEGVLIACDKPSKALTAEIMCLAFERIYGKANGRHNPYSPTKAA
jgi:hypothetical protein